MNRYLALLSALLFSLLPVGQQLQPAVYASSPAASSPPRNPLHRGESKEVVSLRTRTSRTYAEDGHYRAVFSTHSVNYKDAHGDWQPIDDSLIASSSSGFAYENTSNRYTVRFPSDIGNGPIRLEYGNTWAQFSLQGQHGAGTVSGSTDTFAIGGGTIAYTAGSDALKETITLDSPSSPSRFVFNLRTSPGISVQQNTNGGIDFLDGQGHVAFSLMPPVMQDSASVPTVSHAVSMTLDQGGSGTTVTVSADQSWLADPARVYPVVIDPSAIIGDAFDCYIASGTYANTNSCSPSTLKLGYDGTTAYRILLPFNPESTLPSNVTILNAEVGVYISSKSTSNTTSLGAYQVTRTWTSQATWNKYDGTNAWTTPGGDASTTPAYTATGVGGSTGWVHWYPTQLIQNWVSRVTPDNGFLLKEPSETVSNVLQITGGITNTANVPYLTVTYEPWVGEQSFYPLAGDQQLSDRMDMLVNVANGNLIIHNTDVSMPGIGLPLVLDRYYNTFNATTPVNSSFDGAWQLGTGADISLKAFNDGSVAFYAPSGYQIVFIKNIDGSFTAPPGIDSTLAFNASKNQYNLTENASGHVYTFTNTGQFFSEGDRAGNTITYHYDTNGYLTSITDTQGRTTAITHDPTFGYITEITDPAGRTYKYGYDGNNLLSTYTDPNGKVTTYGNDGLYLNKITDPAGNITTIAHNTSGQVTSYTRVTNNGTLAGNTTTLSYSTGVGTTGCASGTTGYTVVTDPKSHQTTYCYDAYGRTTDTIDPLTHKTNLQWNPDNQVTKTTLPTQAFSTTAYDGNNNPTSDQAYPNKANTGAAITSSAAYGNTTFKYNPTSETDPRGNTTSFGYTSQGLVSTVTDASTHTTTINRNSNGTVSSVVDANSHTTSYAYYCITSGVPNCSSSDTGLLYQVTPPGPLGTTTYTYDNANRIATATDGKGQTATYTYDGLDRVTGVTYSNAAGTQTQSIGYSYDGDGNLLSQTDATGATTYTYDTLGRLTQESLPNGKTVSYTYDAADNLLTKTDGGGTVTYGYDNADELTSVKDPQGATTAISYDANGNEIAVAYPNGVTENRSFDDAGELTRIWGSTSSSTLDSYTYAFGTNPNNGQPADLRSSVTDVAGNVTSYTYDSLERLTQAIQKNSGGSQLASYSYAYDPVGNMTSQTINGATTSMSYNPADELASAGSTSYGYDANGNQTSASGRSSLSYNLLDQTVGLAGPTGGGMSSGYAGTGQTHRVSGGNLAYQDDATGISSMAASSSSLQTTGNSLSAAYTTSDQPVSVAAGGTATYKVTVTNTGTSTWPSGGSNPVHLGIHFAGQGGGFAANSSTWSTDQRYSLPNDVAPGQSATLTVTVTAPSTTGSYVLEAQMVQEYVAWFNQYLDSPITVSTGGLAASYRTSGPGASSLSPGGSATYQVTVTNNGTSTWPAGGANPVHLGIHFARQGGGYYTGSATWAIDQRYSLPNDVAPGQSVTLSVTITAPRTGGSYVLEYQMVQEGIVWFPEYQDSAMSVGSAPPSPSGTTYFTRTPDGQLLSERTSSGTYYYLFDGLGSVVGLTNSSGAVVNSYAYDPYGNATSVSEQVNNPFRFIGAIWDASTGLYKVGERYYDPTIGRFTQLDPLGGGYIYADDNPANETDPTGLCPVCAAGALVLVPGVGEVVAGAVVVAAALYAGYRVGQVIHTALSKKTSRKSGKERASDVPSWARGEKIRPGETPDQAARRVFKEHGKEIGRTGPGSEFNRVKKYLARNRG